ncbi:MAG: hypothetical protein MI924_23550 [Chloroflexales bacterium]|nr:hypothetical protein [Chloroflexales bacterium]
MRHKSSPAAMSRHERGIWLVLGPLLFMLVVGLYFIARYGGNWAEADSTTFTYVIRPFVAEGRIIPENGPVYPNGYTFQSISAFILAFTGLDLVALQQWIYPLLSVVVVIPAWLFYREVTGSARGAALGAVLLLVQPEFLFVVLRSSHEKFTRAFMLLCLFFLFRSLRLDNQPRLLAVNISLFYLVAFALSASNNLLAHSFIFAMIIALVLGLVLRHHAFIAFPQRTAALQRLFYASLISLIIIYVIMFYAYPPAAQSLKIMKSVVDQLSALFLDVQTTGGENTTNAYAYTATGWISWPTYFLVSIANWVILGISVTIWAVQGMRWFWFGRQPSSHTVWLVWLFYTAFAAQGILSVVSDASGALSSNLQHRLFSSFVLIAVALVALTLHDWRPRRFNLPLRVILASAVACVAILSTFKATNEPLLSNKWTFYRPSELAALDWSDAYLRNELIWTAYDERLAVAYLNARGVSPNKNEFVGYASGSIRNLLISPVTRLRGARLRQPLPVPADALRVYDNGETEMYHLRPETPYQR